MSPLKQEIKENRLIPYGRQWIDEDDIKDVVAVLRSDFLTQGPKIEEFEKGLASYCDSKYAVAVSNGTAALHLACLAANIREGDRVISTPNTFVASTNCVLFCGGRPEFVDIETRTANIDADKIEDFLGSLGAESVDKTKAIIPVHFAGLPCNMGKIKEIALKHDLLIIEDACHALGAEYQYNGKWIKVGSCKHSDMAVFSFHPVKHVTTGEGGAVLTNSPELYERLLSLRSHGITKNPEKFTNEYLAFNDKSSSETKLPNPWYYEIHELGYNYRITDIQCALGISQLKRLNEKIKRRRIIASRYNDAFKDLRGVQVSLETETERSSFHLYVLQIDFEKIGKSRAEVMYELRKQGIGTQVHYIPVYLHPYYKETLHYDSSNYPVTETYYNRCLSLPIFPKMNDSEVDYVIEQVVNIFKM
jgi:UDP-4-amino-4,6-dideoxy-N-acetyl-beta-L-altrosamine transaminase